jgi:hypothetical protein
VRRDLGGLLLDHTRKIAFSMLRTQDRAGAAVREAAAAGLTSISVTYRSLQAGHQFALLVDVEDVLLTVASGAGPLLQRDYWAAFAGCALKPSEIMTHVKTHFCELPPASLVQFVAPAGVNTNAELDIRIVPALSCRVRVLHQDAQASRSARSRDTRRQDASRLAPTAIRLAM